MKKICCLIASMIMISNSQAMEETALIDRSMVRSNSNINLNLEISQYYDSGIDNATNLISRTMMHTIIRSTSMPVLPKDIEDISQRIEDEKNEDLIFEFEDICLNPNPYKSLKKANKFIEKHGANINSNYDSLVSTALDLSLMQQNTNPTLKEIIKILLQKGANVNSYNSNNNTLLNLAIASGDNSLINIILNANPDVNLKDANGNSALEYAIFHSRLLTKIIILKGADSNSITKAIRTALDRQAKNKPYMSKVFLENVPYEIALKNSIEYRISSYDYLNITPDIENNDTPYWDNILDILCEANS